ncbi:hypothetical protein A2348_02820 [Candidatus Uhrbacteria bacterium RIFOXYB12_FULL_58_10]|uniref:Uncharacterized protein n=1 Tax=Candidatus Uhrbacteria bacterium RIFOXYB2_FULL_57_15 TaxID=1802422 RepID=A0A1F7W8A7_9BACT|nr:MAG: hypothetical protein A2348_02820 [Candidatus Uhrbacteria bacterium RIFOXYB12_FULL_58_10]OGL98457.1 MAG: hypothetical protein A2304_02070 [Candidatus Uhrbacteria bacterium RIFOXYB2_FULL_57_15]OGL99228.1 MAG: hypothetical protein A2501_03465 [Candidatus Uhrbacteria bacterium RIFOXYC12_FULL_57_11]
MARREEQVESGIIANAIERDTKILEKRRRIAEIERDLKRLDRQWFADVDAESIEAHLLPSGLDEVGHQVVEAVLSRSPTAREYFALLLARRRVERQIRDRIRKIVMRSRRLSCAATIATAAGPAVH